MTGTKTPKTGSLPELAPDLRAVLERHADRLDLELVDRALRFSASAHRGQKRMSGEDFVSHTIAVALILAEQLLDSTTIVAALLHDVVEDSDVRMEDIAREFGPEVAGIVDAGVPLEKPTVFFDAGLSEPQRILEQRPGSRNRKHGDEAVDRLGRSARR